MAPHRRRRQVKVNNYHKILSHTEEPAWNVRLREDYKMELQIKKNFIGPLAVVEERSFKRRKQLKEF